jgi:3-oxoacyl-[acyl-carrier-protein] synthase III
MRFDDLYVAGVGTWLPPQVSTEQFLADGRCDAKLARMNDLLAVTVAADKDSPPEMAASAARTALQRAACPPADIQLILHASLYFQGHDLWGAASYVQRAAVGNSCPAMEVRQVSNGGMAALHLAAAYLTAVPDRPAALITAADKFPLPGFDRWRTDPGTVYADGGAALVLSRARGFARIRSLVLVSDPELEGMHRAGDACGAAPMTYEQPLDLDAHTRGFLAQLGTPATMARLRAGLDEVLERALGEAGVSLAEVSRFALPHFGRRRLQTNYLRRLGVAVDRTTWHWSRQVGHLGAADQIASFNHLMESGSLAPGDICLLMGVGAGFTWSCAVAQIIEAPRWEE